MIPTKSEILIFFFFFFQAEDGIRDLTVTGVQTCALPIFVFVEKDRLGRVARNLARFADHRGDRKSTRLNSSHSQISYAVFCLKKKRARPGTASWDTRWSTRMTATSRSSSTSRTGQRWCYS